MADIAQRRKIRRAVDEELVAALRRNGLSGRAMALLGPATEGARADLSAAAVRDAMSGMVAAALTARVAQSMAAAGVPCLFVKGPTFSAAVGEPVGCRPAVDVDALVHPEDIARADRVVAGLGYTHLRRHPRLGWPIERLIEVERTYGGRGPAVDLHWEIDDRPPWRQSRMGDLWDRRRTVDVGGAEVWTLDAVDTLLVCAIHGNREGWRQGKWLVDLALALDSLGPADRTRLPARAQELRCGTALAVAVEMVRRIDAGLVEDHPADIRGAALAADLHASSGGQSLDLGLRAGAARRSWRWRTADTRVDAIAGLSAAILRGAPPRPSRLPRRTPPDHSRSPRPKSEFPRRPRR